MLLGCSCCPLLGNDLMHHAESVALQVLVPSASGRMSRHSLSLPTAPAAGKAGSSRQQRLSESSGSGLVGGKLLPSRPTALAAVREQPRQTRRVRPPRLLPTGRPVSGTTAAGRLRLSSRPASRHKRAQVQPQLLPLLQRRPAAATAGSPTVTAVGATASGTRRSVKRRRRRWADGGCAAGCGTFLLL